MTTGLYYRTDRIVEVAVVRTDSAGRALGRYETILNPERDAGSHQLHGITAGHMMQAPRFQDVAGDIGAMLDGAVVVAHDARFDRGFLQAEFLRCGIEISIDLLCTIELLYASDPTAPRRLEDCCAYYGLPVSGPHRSSSDAAATAALLVHVLAMWDYPGMPSPFAFDGGPPPSGRSLPREATADPRESEGRYLAQLIGRLPSSPSGSFASALAAAEYLNQLEHALLDHRITAEESAALASFASEAGLSLGEVAGIHASYVHNLCQIAIADGQVTDDERAEIDIVATLLRVSDWELSLNARMPQAAEPRPPLHAGFDPGTVVCFTGAMSYERPECEAIARQAGLAVWPRITRDVQVLVVADPDTQSSKARKAREYGALIVSERAFWNLIGYDTAASKFH